MPSGAEAVRAYLRGLPGPAAPPATPPATPPAAPSAAEEQMGRILAFRRVSRSLPQLFAAIERQMPALRAIVFLDADQYVWPVRDFAGKPGLHEHYHIVVCLAPRCCPRVLMDYFGSPWMTILMSSGAERDAADCEFMVAASAMNVWFRAEPTPFLLVSKDHFARALARRLGELELRPVEVVTPRKFVGRLAGAGT